MEAELSIHELLKKGKFEASLITTYNAYLPFYEEVVLRSLISAGCHHNILLMDAAQLSENLLSPTLRPQSAGFDYTLIPMKAPGAFHPKIILLLGRKKGVLLVGSHNMTYSGLGVNRELTTKVEITAGKEKYGVGTAQSAWEFVLSWLEEQRDRVPKQLIDVALAIRRFAPWLSTKPSEEPDDLQFIGSTPKGASLWERVQEGLIGPCQRVTVLGPFFDKNLDFLTTVQKTLSPEELIVGIDPNTVEIPTCFTEFVGARFVDASSLAKRSGYLHAKAVYIESESNNNWLVTGSANPSAPAWIESPLKRNAEAVVIQGGQAAVSLAQELGLSTVGDLFDLTPDVLSALQSRISSSSDERPSSKMAKVAIATATKEGILFPQNLFDLDKFERACMLDETQQTVAVMTSWEKVDDGVVFATKEDMLPRIRFADVCLAGGELVLALVHHTSQILKGVESKRAAQFRSYLESLSGDNPELEGLIISVEKIIFDSQDEIHPGVRRKARSEQPETTDDKEIDTLAVHLKETKRGQKPRRMLCSGDLAHLLDVLIHHLGVGLEKQAEHRDRYGRSEEELVGSDDEDTPEKQIELNGPEVVKMCHRKVRRLGSRMLKQFERACSGEAKPDHTLTQLVAVLAILRELRTLDLKAPWIPLGETLVPEKERRKLFAEAIRFLFGQKHHLYEKALDELVDEPLDEVSRLHGLLLWLARECGADFRPPEKTLFGESREEKYQRLFYQAQLLFVLPRVSDDKVATAEVSNSLIRTTKLVARRDAKEWIDVHLYWGYALSGFIHRLHDMPTIERPPQRGDFAYPSYAEHPALSVVLATDGRFATLVDIDGRNKEIIYEAKKVTPVNMNALPKLVRPLNEVGSNLYF